MSAANLKDAPIKLSNYVDKVDEFNNCQVLTLVDRSTAEFSTHDIPFEKVRHKLEKLNTFLTLQEIVSNVPPEDSVNCIAYASLSNNPEEINTKYGRKMKRDILLSDDSAQLKMTLWNNQIDLVQSEGNFKFKELRVKVYNGLKYLTSTTLTVIIPAPATFAPPTQSIECDTAVVTFPAKTIDHFEINYFCLKCNFKAVVDGEFLICSQCTSESLKTDDSEMIKTKASFVEDGILRQITIPHQIMMEILKANNMVGKSHREIKYSLMTMKDSRLTFNKNNCTALSFDA